jgi:superfamily II DNA/RNA helicase
LAFSATFDDAQRATLRGWMREPSVILLNAQHVTLAGVAQYYLQITASQVRNGCH